MRTIERVKLPDDLSVEKDQVGFADWREPPINVLDHVDELLRPHGLEVVLIDQRDDRYYWRFERRAS